MGGWLSKVLERVRGTTSTIQEAGQEDDVVEVQSPFTVAEMWALVPGLVRDELFDHVDLRQATRLTRVSSSWSEEMKKIIKRSNGIVVLEDWTTVKAGEEASWWPQFFTAVPKRTPASHLILVSNGSVQVNQFEKCRFFTQMLPSLTKITLGDKVLVHPDVYVIGSVVGSLLSSSVKLAIFPKSMIGLSIIVILEVTEQGLIWPYPEEQTEWLLRSLGNLKGDVLEMVKYLDGKWTIGHPAMSAGLEKLNLTSDVTSDKRRLDSLDLAFLGRLLVYLDKREKIPGQEPPLHAFPDSSRPLVVSRQLRN